MANEVEVKTKIYIRHDTEENWTSINPVLAEGELGYSVNEKGTDDEGNIVTEYILKIGDGENAWTELPSNHVYYNKEDIDNLLGKIESGESDLGTRVDALESKVGNEADGDTQASGLIADVRTLQEEVETESTGLLAVVGNADSGLVYDVNALKETTDGLVKEVEGSEEEEYKDGLLSRVSTIETTLNGEDEEQGLIADVSELQTSLSTLTEYVGTASEDDKEATGLTKQVEDNAKSIDEINATIAGLNYSETEVEGDYVTSVTQEKGKISVTKSSFDTTIDENSGDGTIATSKAIYTLVNRVQEALEQQIGDLVNLSIKVVDKLPEVDKAEDNIIYLVKCEDETSQHSENDTYDEYVLVEKDGEKAFEKIGNTDIDLSNYVTTSDLETKIEDAKKTLEDGTNSIKEELEEQIKTLSTAEEANATSIESINEIIGAGDNYDTTASGTIINRISTLESITEEQGESITSINTTLTGEDGESGLVKDVEDLQSTVGNEDEGLVKDVADNTFSIEVLDKQINGDSTNEEDKGIVGQVESLENSVENINTSLTEYAKTEDVNNTIKELGSAKVSADGKYVSGVEVKTDDTTGNYVLGITEADLPTTDLTGYVTNDSLTSTLSSYLTSTEAQNTYQEKGNYITESDLESKFYIEDGILYYGEHE